MFNFCPLTELCFLLFSKGNFVALNTFQIVLIYDQFMHKACSNDATTTKMQATRTRRSWTQRSTFQKLLFVLVVCHLFARLSHTIANWVCIIFSAFLRDYRISLSVFYFYFDLLPAERSKSVLFMVKCVNVK